ncbi:uncharacterized protein LOC119076285 [Bradysia coprophila]|uniref:uncharacterized protein LOC119076285 n=1 Tax=Bradysia coprophila TaxID=38358 RepID=UPI00187DBC11|nr:uncharacterized protein LOC119076285 [Bradysia coprophila]XP_037038842.1 uncharacterized protein LOC119076285 [Bradysia coprophila]
MQSLESSCQEADFMVNEALNKLRRTTNDSSSSLLIDHNDYTSAESSSFITNPSRSPPATLVAPVKQTTISHQSSCEKRPATDTHSLSSISAYASGSNPSKRSKISSSSSSSAFPTATSSKSSNTATSTESSRESPFFDIHDKLRELYGLLYYNDEQNRRTETRVKLRSRSQALELLVARENLNTVILNLYPGNKGYSLAFRQETTTGKPFEQHGDNSHGLGTSRNATKSQPGAADDSTENLLETIRWPYEVEGLLECIDNETLPMLFIDLLESRVPSVFYSGCVIVEVRDYRQTFQISACCDTYFVLLKPTNQTLLADVNLIAAESDFSSEEKLALESQLVLATSGPLCLDPNPQIGRNAINSQHRRQMWNTSAIRRQMKKFSQVAINRKRKTDQFTHIHGLELHDHLTRLRQKQRVHAETVDDPSKLPKRPIDIVQPIRAPNLDLPPLTVPSKVNLNVKAYERPKKKTDFKPQLVEEHILSTDREDRVCHTKISIYQRPVNSEFLGELYVDRDYKEGEKNGEACQFSLGTRTHADRYIKQFTDIFSEEGRKTVTVTYNVPGKPSAVTVIGPKRNQIIHQQQVQQQVQQTAQQQLLQQHQMQFQNQPILANQTVQPLAPTPSTVSSVNATNLNTLPGNKIMPNNSATIIGITNLNQSQQQFLQSQANQTQMQQIYNPCDINNSTMTAPVQQHSQQQQTHLNLANGSFVVVQQPSGNLTNLTGLTVTNQQPNTTIRGSALAQSVPVLQAHLQSTTSTNQQQQSQQHDQMPPQQTSQQQQILQQKNAITTIHSTNPEITALVTSFMNSESQFQQQAAANSNAQKSSNNAAIISLLNSAPAAMTSSPVVNSTLSASNSHGNAVSTSVPSDHIVNQKQSQTAMHHAITQSILAGNVRKMTGNIPQKQQQQQPQQQQNRIIHPTNLVSVSTNLIASQLASPPALMSSANINPQNFNFAQSSILSNNNNNNNTVKQQVILSSSNARLLNQAQAIRRDSMTAPSPGSDSNTSNTSNVSYQMSSLNALLATSPNSTNVDGSTHSQNTPTLLDRLTQQTITSQSPGPTAPQFMSPSPKTPTIQQQQIQVQSPASISPLSSPPPQQTTTINVQGFNLSSLQGAMSAFPGILENVQVQIPGQPFSLSLSGAAGAALANANSQPTSLLISVPVTSSTQSNSGQVVASSSTNVIGPSTQTVVLTNANAQSGTPGSMLSLPLAQLVGVKGLSQQTLRAASPMNTAGGSIQLLSTIQRPRTVPINASTFNAKQLTARGIGQAQRNFQISSMKLGSPLTVAPASHITTTANITANPLVMTSQQLHLKLHKQAQSQPYLNMSPSSQTTTNVVAPTGDISITSPIQAKMNRPSSTTDVNK